jgi:hypothetical protein
MSTTPDSGINRADSSRSDVRTLPTSLAAMATGVTEATVRKWVSRGKLTRYGSPGRAEYDIEELLKLVAQRSSRGRGGSSRTATPAPDPGGAAVETGTVSENNQQSIHTIGMGAP